MVISDSQLKVLTIPKLSKFLRMKVALDFELPHSQMKKERL
jgi:hypothetical protein